MQEDKKLIYGKIEVDGRCLDLLFTEVEVARANKRATEPTNSNLIPENVNTCWPIEKPPECSFWNRITGNCK
jgi:hypothetical protein